MTTAYIANGKYVTIENLTCPNGHSNRAIDFDKYNPDNDELLCEFMHIRPHFRFTKERGPKNDSERHLFERYGFDIPITVLAVCRVCNSVFFYAAIRDDDYKTCQCFDCELSRIRERKPVLNEFALAKARPGDYARAKLGLPMYGNLSKEQSEKAERFLERPLNIPKRATYVPREMPRVSQQAIDMEKVPF